MSDKPNKRSGRRIWWCIAIGLLPLSLLMSRLAGELFAHHGHSVDLGVVLAALLYNVSAFVALTGVIWISILIGLSMTGEPKRRAPARICWVTAAGLLPLSFFMWLLGRAFFFARPGLDPERLMWGLVYYASPFAALIGVIWTSILIGISFGESSKK
jgi:hypothetical protein